ncbi:MAG: hypothetical protein A3F18_03900 [Legionellales bacterium RIFCSPHIGHO2_12_FULL_37_14]|nr:MAG: hypothetical protein A3F18_03900 [Legionellales bacterium RIFCSPHIGHO2_12_FULL_37_14]
MHKKFFLLIICYIFFATCYAKQNLTLHRNFWTPIYRGTPINYCFKDEITCGYEVANLYCHLMGYQNADRIIKAYNLGHTRYLASSQHCFNPNCNGFKMIRCKGKIIHKPIPSYLYTKKHFPYPRYKGERLAFCADGKAKGCGQKAAYSFCRRQGYMQTIGYKQEKNLPITKAINNQRICIASRCHGFEYIDCER